MLQCPAPIIHIPSPPRDNEWLKNMISVIVGLLLGVASALFIEPLKQRRLRKLDAKLAEEALYEELGSALTAIRYTVLQDEAQCSLFCERFKFERFDYYFAERREVFYAMPDSKGIRSLHGQLTLNLLHEQIQKYGAKHQVQELLNAFEYSMDVKEVSRGRVELAAQKQNADARKKGPVLYQHIMANRGH